jgi:hypothetical protein
MLCLLISDDRQSDLTHSCWPMSLSEPFQTDHPALVSIRSLQGFPNGLGLPDDDNLLAGARDSGVEPGRIEQAARGQRHDDLVGFRALGAVAGESVAE